METPTYRRHLDRDVPISPHERHFMRLSPGTVIAALVLWAFGLGVLFTEFVL